MEFVVKTQSGKKFRIGVEESREGRIFSVNLDGREMEVDLVEQSRGVFSLIINGISYEAFLGHDGSEYRMVMEGEFYNLTVRETEGPGEAEAEDESGPVEVRSVIPGKVIACLVREGDVVSAGQGLVVIEAMKMENEIKAKFGGRVSVLAVEPGQAVEANALLIRLEPVG